MIWLECKANDNAAFTVLSNLPNSIRSGWLAGAMFWQSPTDQCQHRSALPFRVFQPLEHAWTGVSEGDVRWNWLAEAKARGATGDVVVWHCTKCDGVRFDCLGDGTVTHLVARNTGDESVVRRAFGLFAIYYGPALYPAPDATSAPSAS